MSGEPRLELGHFPTPVRELRRLRAELACAPRLYIKHDDYSGPGFGGNKVRKLEYYFGHAVAHGFDTVVTCGGEKSNHCRITAALAARLGFQCHLVLNPSRTPVVGTAASLWLDGMYGARLHRVENGAARAPRMAALAASLATAGRKVLEIPLGASTPLGALGFVRAAEELRAQLDPEWIVHCTSSGGTQAGLLAGLHGPRVLGISADDPAASIAATVRAILDGMGVDSSPEILVDDRFTGDGYGIPSPAGLEAAALLARTEGVVLDPVYTAKAMAGLLARLSAGFFGSSDQVLFWHTGGQLALFGVKDD